MRELNTTHPLPGLCSLQDLPEPYQLAFRQGAAHHLPGHFLPAEVDWFIQIFMLPFSLVYALPPLTIPVALLTQLVQEPESYGRFFQTIRQQNAGEMVFMLVLFGLLGLLLVYCAWFAWEGGSSFVRTWQAHQLQRRREHGFGIVLLESVLVARLIDNIGGKNCLWLPRQAIANIIWRRIREEGAKHSRWVYRTQLCYVTEHRGKPQKRWLTLRGDMVKAGDPKEDVMRDAKRDCEAQPLANRALFEQLYEWWRSPTLNDAGNG